MLRAISVACSEMACSELSTAALSQPQAVTSEANQSLPWSLLRSHAAFQNFLCSLRTAAAHCIMSSLSCGISYSWKLLRRVFSNRPPTKIHSHNFSCFFFSLHYHRLDQHYSRKTWRRAFHRGSFLLALSSCIASNNIADVRGCFKTSHVFHLHCMSWHTVSKLRFNDT